MTAPRDVIVWVCNCSICAMKRNDHFIVPAAKFKLVQGLESLSEYKFNTEVARHKFCKVCGVQAFYHPRSNPDGVAVTLSCLDDNGNVGTVEKRYFDGKNWEKQYAASDIANCSVDATPS